jgi:hypothetical protein
LQAVAFETEDAFIEESAESLIAELVSNTPAKKAEASHVDFGTERSGSQTEQATEKLILDEIAAQWPQRAKKTAPRSTASRKRKAKKEEPALVEVVRTVQQPLPRRHARVSSRASWGVRLRSCWGGGGRECPSARRTEPCVRRAPRLR